QVLKAAVSTSGCERAARSRRLTGPLGADVVGGGLVSALGGVGRSSVVAERGHAGQRGVSRTTHGAERFPPAPAGCGAARARAPGPPTRSLGRKYPGGVRRCTCPGQSKVMDGKVQNR